VHVGALELAVGLSVVLIGAIVQGSIGFGLNLLSAPFIALVVPAALPATLVLVALPASITTLVREHRHLELGTLRWMLIGAVPGTITGLLIVGNVDGSELATLVGAITLTGVALSLLTRTVKVTPSTSFAAGFASNVFGTAASVGGPPVALLLQHHAGRAARPTLGAFFATSATMSLIGYPLAGVIDLDHVLFALALAPAMVAGLWASRHLHGVVDRGWLRPAVLTLSAIAGIAAIVRGLT
jgi:uncharacterized membrane protein YfcA